MKPVRKVRGFWEPHEIAILRECYPVGGAEAVKAKLPKRGLSAIAVKCHQLGIRISEAETKRRIAETQKRLMNMKKPPEDATPPPEYLQAADIFQVGYRVARDLGVIHEFA